MRINNYASENVRVRPFWKRVPCPECGRGKGENCKFSFSSKGYNLFIHEQRLLAGEKLKMELEVAKYKDF